MKNLQDLRDKLHNEIEYLKDELVDNLEELTPFKIGKYKGRIRALEWVCDELRGALKHHECEFSDKVCLMCGETACEDG